MKWYVIGGSWRTIDARVERDVREAVRDIILQGDGIITGAALGVDAIATESVLEHGDVRTQLRLFLPIALDALCAHFWKRAKEGVITEPQAGQVTSLLKKVAGLCKECIRDDWGYTQANEESYYARNTRIIEECDALLAFQVNDGKGTRDAIDKARQLGKPVTVKKYRVPG
jgi:hypothetical protein